MENYDDKMIVDDEVEFKYNDQNRQNQQEQERINVTTYSNQNVRQSSFFSVIFSKKFIALTISTLSIIMTFFLKFLRICGVYNAAFNAIWFFLCAGLSISALILNIVGFTKTKKFDFNVSSVLTILSLAFLALL